MTEGNGSHDSALVVPVMSVHQLYAELEIERGKRADAERRAERAEADLKALTQESIAALQAAGDHTSIAIARRFQLKDELRGIVPR